MMKQLLKQIYNERRSNAFYGLSYCWCLSYCGISLIWFMSLCISIISQWALI